MAADRAPMRADSSSSLHARARWLVWISSAVARHERDPGGLHATLASIGNMMSRILSAAPWLRQAGGDDGGASETPLSSRNRTVALGKAAAIGNTLGPPPDRRSAAQWPDR